VIARGAAAPNRDDPAPVELSSMPDEDRVIMRAAAGETAAFRELYEWHRTDVARLVYRILGPRSDMEAVIQEIFVQVYRELRNFRGQLKFSTWLRRITVNVVLVVQRAARSRPFFTAAPLAAALLRRNDNGPDKDAERRERVLALWATSRPAGLQEAHRLRTSRARGDCPG